MGFPADNIQGQAFIVQGDGFVRGLTGRFADNPYGFSDTGFDFAVVVNGIICTAYLPLTLPQNEYDYVNRFTWIFGEGPMDWPLIPFIQGDAVQIFYQRQSGHVDPGSLDMDLLMQYNMVVPIMHPEPA